MAIDQNILRFFSDEVCKIAMSAQVPGGSSPPHANKGNFGKFTGASTPKPPTTGPMTTSASVRTQAPTQFGGITAVSASTPSPLPPS